MLFHAWAWATNLTLLRFRLPTFIRQAYASLAKVMRKELKARGIKKLKVAFSTEIPVKPLFCADGSDERIPGSSPFVPPCAGIIMAGEIVKDLL